MQIDFNQILFRFIFADDETSPISYDKTKNSKEEMQTRLEIFLQQNKSQNKNDHITSAENGVKNIRNTPAFSSFTSSNTSPVSTLTGSSEADVPRTIQDSNIYNSKICSESIGSLMSVSISGHSNGSMSPSIMRRHSVTSKLTIF